jgi:hypothetical protein
MYYACMGEAHDVTAVIKGLCLITVRGDLIGSIACFCLALLQRVTLGYPFALSPPSFCFS